MKNMLDELKKLDEDVEVSKDFRENVMKKIRQIEAENKKMRKKKYFTKYIVPYVSSVAVICIAVFVGFKNSGNKEINMNMAPQQAKNDFVISSNDMMLSGATSQNSFDSNSFNNSDDEAFYRYQVEGESSNCNDSISIDDKDLEDSSKNPKNDRNGIEAVQEDKKVEMDSIGTMQSAVFPGDALSAPKDDVISIVCEILKNNGLEIVYEDFNYALVSSTTVEKVESLLGDEALNLSITSGENDLVKIEEKED